MDSTSNKNTTTDNSFNNQEQGPFSSFFSHPFPPYDHLHTLNPITTTDEPPSSTQTHPPPPPAARTSKKRTRASRRAPTTVLTTDTSNFRSLVQQFTGFPTPSFPPPPPPPSSSSSSSFPYFLQLRPMPPSLVDSIAAINAAINGNVSLETVISSSGSNTAAALASYPFVNTNTDLAPQFGDLGGPSGALSGWAECGDHQDDLNICRELVKPSYKRQTIRGTEGAAIESWSASSSD